MASLIKLTVEEKVVHRSLLTTFLQRAKHIEHSFACQDLPLSFAMLLSQFILFLSVIDCLLVGLIQLHQFIHKFVPLTHQLIYQLLGIVDHTVL